MTRAVITPGIVFKIPSVLLVATLALTFWLVILTFPGYFFFNPMETEDALLRSGQIASTVGWVALGTVAPAIAFAAANGNRRFVAWLGPIALLWPASILIIHATLALQTGDWYLGYLVEYPIFWISDLAIPLAFLVLAQVWNTSRVLQSEPTLF